MKELKLFPRDNIWYVEHLLDGKPDPEISDLWEGETCLPTPFLLATPVWQVAQSLARLNPGKRILYNARTTDHGNS